MRRVPIMRCNSENNMKQNHRSSGLLIAFILFGVTGLVACGGGQSDGIALRDASACTPAGGTVCNGKANFHDRALVGLPANGRARSDCQMDPEAFHRTPA